MLDLDTTNLELTALLIHEIVLRGGDSPKSFPEGTDSVVIFEPSNIFSVETKVFSAASQFVFPFYLSLDQAFYTMLSDSESVCSGGNCYSFLELF